MFVHVCNYTFAITIRSKICAHPVGAVLKHSFFLVGRVEFAKPIGVNLRKRLNHYDPFSIPTVIGIVLSSVP